MDHTRSDFLPDLGHDRDRFAVHDHLKQLVTTHRQVAIEPTLAVATISECGFEMTLSSLQNM